MAENEQPNSFKKMFDFEFLNSDNISEKKIVDYRTSDVRTAGYKSVMKDSEFSDYVKEKYGSYDDYSMQTKLFKNPSIYDPTTDYFMDVTIITEDANYKTDYISPNEIILENISGVCTIWFVKMDGNTRKLTCTLNEDLMPGLQADQRSNFFGPLAGDRIGVWDLIEKRWKSFYAARAFKFVRDDTTTVE